MLLVVTSLLASVDCAASSDIYLLIDGSGSIDTENFNLLKAFAERFVRNVNVSMLIMIALSLSVHLTAFW